ncbi:MAG: hypothetical protein N3J91_16395 [Verrucomicrobiae bacterium]|nr:hypothetical protein [Verrucomicrobiae bacterium]
MSKLLNDGILPVESPVKASLPERLAGQVVWLVPPVSAPRRPGRNEYIQNPMKTTRMLVAVLLAAALSLGTSAVLAAQSCCVQAKSKGKDCAHPCCVEARKAEKTCEKCQKDASCCDKAIAKGKACAHPCCVESAKEKKICEKCNSPAKK